MKRLLATRALETPPRPKHMGGMLKALQDDMPAPTTTSTGPGGARNGHWPALKEAKAQRLSGYPVPEASYR